MLRHDEFEPWSPDPRPDGSDAEQMRQPPPAEVDSSPSPVRADSLDPPDADTTSRSHHTFLTGRDGAETRLTAHVTEEERSRVREELTAIIESQRKARHKTSSQPRPNARSASMTDPSQLDAALTNVLGQPDKPTTSTKPQTVGRPVGRGEASRGASLQGLRGRSRSASIMAKDIYASDPLDPRWEREKHRLLKASSERLIRGSLEHHFELLAARRNGFSPTRPGDSESPDRASDAAAAASLADLAAGEEVPEGNNSPLGSKTPRTKQRQKAAVAEKAGKVREMFERQLALVRDAEREKMLSAQQASERNMRQFSHHVDALLRGVQEATALINTPAVTQDADGHLTAEQQRGHHNVHTLEREHPSISASLAHGEASDDDEAHVQDHDDHNHQGKVGDGFQAPDTQDGVEARLQALSSALHQLLTVAFAQYDRVACGRCDQSIETAVAAPLFVETTEGRRAVDVSDATLVRVLRGEVLEGDGSILSMSPGQLSPGGLQTPCSATAANADRLSEMLRLAELEVHAKTVEAQKHQRRAEESVKAVIAAERAREAMKIKLSTAEASRDQAIEEASMLEESLRLERSSMGQGSPYSPHSPHNIRSPLLSSIRRGASGLMDEGDHSPHMLSPDHSRVVHTGGDHDHDQDLGDDDGGDDCGGEEVPTAVRGGVSMEELSEADRDHTDSSLQRSPPPPPMPTQQEPRHLDTEAPHEAMKSPESEAVEADGDVEGSRATADPTAPYQRDTTCEGRTSATLRDDSQAPVAAELFAPSSVGPDAPHVQNIDEETAHHARQAQDTEESPVEAARVVEQVEHHRSGTDEPVDVEPAAPEHHAPSAADLSRMEEMYRARHAVSMSCTEAVVGKLEIANDGLSALLGDYHSLVTDTFGALPAATASAEEVTGSAPDQREDEEATPALGTSHRHLALPLQEALPPPEALPSENDNASPTAAVGDEASPDDGTIDDEKSPPATSRNHSATEQPPRSRPSRNETHRAGDTDRVLESPSEREAALASEVEELKARCEETESVLAAVLRRLGTIHELSDVPGQPLPVPEALHGLLSSGVSSRAPSSAALKHVSTDDI